MAPPNRIEIDVDANTAKAVANVGTLNQGVKQLGSSATSLEGFAKGAGSGLNQMGQAGETAGTGLGKTSAGITSISEQLSVARTQIASFIGAQLGLGAAKEVAQTADEYKNLQARVKLATGEGQAFTTAWDQVVAVAQRTNSNLEATGNLFAKLTDAGKSAGLSTQAAIAQSLSLTETVNQAVQLSGAGASASNAAITQLIQGLQGGVLRGDEFNSVMEQAPRLAKALADGLGVTTGELRKMAEAGALSSETVIEALKGQSDTLKTEFGTLPATVGRAVENLSTSWTLYIGEVDKASGASSAAAGAINALSSNLSTVGNLLIDAGQAAAGLVALRLAQTFTGIGVASAQAATAVATNTAATAANSTAHQANSAAAAREALAFKTLSADVAAQAAALSGNTAATAANTAAKNAAGAASDVAAAGIGRFAAILSTLKTFTLIGLLTNIQDIGTALGEGAAKLMGYKDRTEELARSEKLAAQAVADTLAARERSEALLKRALEKQFELSKAAALSIGEFDKLTKAGDTAAEAVAKIGKDFDLSKQPGIRDAAAVLDKLAADGKLSATEFEGAWSKALKSVDLGVFETQARAAFAGSAREAERLAQVMDATLRESIRRTGLDFDVISGGMGKAAASALNDTETMIKGLDRLKAQGVDAAQVLTASIGKGIATADSQKAIELVRQQIESLRKTLGDKVTDGLLQQATDQADKLAKKLAENMPGIQNLSEAMQKLGITSDESLRKTAATSKEAYDAMRESGTASARELGAGFRKAAEDAIVANNGIAPSWVNAQAAGKGYELVVDSAGKTTVRAMGEAKKAVDALGVSVQQSTVDFAAQAKALDEIAAKYGQSKADTSFKYAKVGSGEGSVLGKTRDERLAGQNAVDNSFRYELERKFRSGTLSEKDTEGLQSVIAALKQNTLLFEQYGAASLEGARSAQQDKALLAQLEGELARLRGAGAGSAGTLSRNTAPRAPSPGSAGAAQAPANTPSTPNSSTTIVKIDLGAGRTSDVTVRTKKDVDALIEALRAARMMA